MVDPFGKKKVEETPKVEEEKEVEETPQQVKNRILEEYGGLESNIPIHSPYWKIQTFTK